jgi:uncharacterized protein (DUF2252 family)
VPRKTWPALDPAELAERQIQLDTRRTKRFPDLLVRKYARMSASPLAYLRGAAPVFYEILDRRPDLAAGPPGEGWIAGDMHLENFGAFRPDPIGAETPKKKAGVALFDLNDFDDALVGPWRFDVLRLTTSLLLGGRELGASGVVALSLVDRLLGAWSQAAFSGRGLPRTPRPVQLLIDQVRARSRVGLLSARTEIHRGARRFVRGPRYANLPSSIVAEVPKAFARYAASLPKEERPHKSSLEVVDCALRIAGTGSLGGLRVAVLVAGKGGRDGGWIFDMKEQGVPSAATIAKAPRMPPAERVVGAMHHCLARAPRMIGTTKLVGLSMFVRKLAPQEDKLNLRRLASEDLPALASYLGALLGAAHRRGATKPPRTSWSKSDLTAVRDRAIYLAGVHEAAYLALCERIRHVLPEPP